jgi:ArsR family transcriptional regulator
MNYEKTSLRLKAMADPKRLQIIDLLSGGTLCACEVLKHFDFTQPTLSHHMKVLEKAGIVSVNKRSQWHHYTLRTDFAEEFMSSMTALLAKSSTTESVQEPNDQHIDKEIVMK